MLDIRDLRGLKHYTLSTKPSWLLERHSWHSQFDVAVVDIGEISDQSAREPSREYSRL